MVFEMIYYMYLQMPIGIYLPKFNLFVLEQYFMPFRYFMPANL